MSSPIAARKNAAAAASFNSTPARVAQAGADPSSVGGVSFSGPPSEIKTLTGLSFKTGQTLQGELIFGKDASGGNLFWLKGENGANYVLRGADGKPVTNVVDAETRALKMIQNDGATRLRETTEPPGSNVKTKPQARVDVPGHEGNRELAIDLTREDVNSKGGEGRSPGGVLGVTDRGEPGSALSQAEEDAAAQFRRMGVPVEVSNANPKGNQKNHDMHAVVKLPNDEIGGSQYAKATINRGAGTFQPDAATWKLPKGASPAFIAGYDKEASPMAVQEVAQVVRNIAEAKATKLRGGYQPLIGRSGQTTLVEPAKPAAKPPTVAAERVTTATPVKRSQTSQTTQTPASLSQTNADRITELFSDGAKMAAHFHARPFGSRPGNSPTSYFYGGHAVRGPFAGLKGGNALELKKNVNARVKEMLRDGTLEALGSGTFNETYLYKPTGQVVRIGRTNSEELSATVSYSNLRGRGIGAQLDLEQSLLIPRSKGLDANHSFGFGVLVMERVPGASLPSITLAKNRGQLSASMLTRLTLVPGKVAGAIVEMHMHRRAHGDLHTGNVMFDKATGEVRVIDFGSSRRTTDLEMRRQDVRDLVALIDQFGDKISEPLMTRAKALYLRALNQYAGPDRNAPVYKNHPELYEPHLKRFNERKATLRSEMAQ